MSDYSNIENYILKEDIGEGNFGKVKLGIFKQTGEEFAIKILNKKKIKIKMKNTVFKENEIITKFNHINVIFVLDIIEDSENYYIVMEYCKSGELFDYIVDKQHLEEDEASIFFYQLINGVEYIHSLGIAHRDLKPENLLLTEQKVLKIIDFGLSHEFNGVDFLKTKCGSPSYAAPEIIKGLPYDGFKTDIWCCGIILYAMVCGYLPFEGENNKILFKNIVECNPEIPDNLSEEIQELISAILRAEPDERITIEEIKNHDFYLRGKELCNIDYQKLQKQLNRRRKNKSNNNYSKNFDKMTDDVEFINQRINITIDNDDNEQYEDIMKINMNNSSNNDINIIDNRNNPENIEDVNNNQNKENENNDIIIKSLRSIHEINTSKITNNSKNENKINININNNNDKGKSNKKIKEGEKNEEPRRHFKFINRRSGLNAFRDKIFSLNKNINKKLENFNNNMNIILNTDVNSIVNNKINRNPLYNNNQIFSINKNKKNLNININQNNDMDNNANTVSSTIHGNQKNIFTNFICSNNTNNKNRNDYNNFININNKKKSIFLDNISSNSKNKKITIQEKDKNRITPRKIKDNNNNNNFPIFKNIQGNNINLKKENNKYNKAFSGLNRKFKNANIIKINSNNYSKGKIQNSNNTKNNINIINNINNTINNYGILNILSTINNNNINSNLHNNKSNKKNKISYDKVEKLKTEGNTFNAIKEIIYNQKRRVNSSYKIKKFNDNYQNKYLNNNIANDYHSTKSSNSGSTKNNRSNFGSNSKNKNKKTKNSSNIIGNNYKRGFILNNINANNNKINNNKIRNNNYMQYPLLNVGNKLFSERGSSNGPSNNFNLVNKNKNIDYISITGNNTKRNKPFNKRSNNFENKFENRIINNKNVIKNNSSEKANNKKECINYFNALSTMFMKTENNFHKNKFKNSNTNSINSRISKNSKNSKKSKGTSKNSKSSKSSKNSSKKYNLIRNAIKNQMNNFIFNKKGGSEGKTNRFIQHSKLFNINNFRNNNNNFHNMNKILNNCMGINNDINKNINTNNNRNNEVNNIKIIKHKGNKFKKIIYNQINFENLKNIYDLNKKKN